LDLEGREQERDKHDKGCRFFCDAFEKCQPNHSPRQIQLAQVYYKILIL
jgi:hypothetical protein